MRVLIITNLFPPHYLGGYELLCQQVCDSLCQRGHQVTVLTSMHGVEDSAREDHSKYQVLRSLKIPVPFGQQNLRYPWGYRSIMEANQRATSAVIQQEKPDVIFMWSQLRLTVGPARAAQNSQRPVAWTFNDKNVLSHSPRLKGIRGLPRWFLSHFLFPSTTLRGLRFKHTTAISQQLKEDLIAEGLPLSNCQVIHQGVPIEEYPIKQNPGKIGKPVGILYTGQLHEYKGVHTLLSASIALKKQGYDLRVTIAGDGDAEYVAQLKNQARSADLDVQFLGRVPRKSLVGIYHSHDLFVFPSIWREPFGLTHLEAMACGTPVISTANGGQGEFLKDGVNALVFKEADVESLSACLTKMIGDPALAERIAHQARVLVEDHYTLDRYIALVEEFLNKARSSS